MGKNTQSPVPVADAAQRLGVSRATVWRMIRRGELPSIRVAGRRLVAVDAPLAGRAKSGRIRVPPLDKGHPIFRLVGAGRSGGRLPGARDKHAILDR